MRLVSNSRMGAADAPSTTSAGKREQALAASRSTASRKRALRSSCARPCPPQPAPNRAAGIQMGRVGLKAKIPIEAKSPPAMRPTHAAARPGPATAAAAAGAPSAACTVAAARAATPNASNEALARRRGSAPCSSLFPPPAEDWFLVSSDSASLPALASPELLPVLAACRDSVEYGANWPKVAGLACQGGVCTPGRAVICQSPLGCGGDSL
mmetsp:Transcript_138764/g.431673  ORF Transcript_138764/g.431673 Transcript_138764/m.431673 type:complete len:211 (-) Transcript_138764:159-791(-)